MDTLKPEAGPRGIGGWMVLFIIGQVVVVIMSVATINSGFQEMTGAWPLGEQFSYLRPLLLVETGMHLAQIFVPLLGLALIARRSTITPSYWRTYLIALVIYAVFDIVMSLQLMADLTPLLDGEAAQDVRREITGAVGMNVRAAIYGVIWSLYWSVSKRVRNTFGPAADAEPALAYESIDSLASYPAPSFDAPAAEPSADRFHRPMHACPACGQMILVAADYCRFCHAPVAAAPVA